MRLTTPRPDVNGGAVAEVDRLSLPITRQRLSGPL